MVNNLIGSCIFVIVKHLIKFFVICTPHKLDLVNLLTYILPLISELLTENIALCVCVCVCVCVCPCLFIRSELSGDNAGSSLLSAVCHQHSDHPAAALHTARLQGSTNTNTLQIK